ncbi:hypothetical protein [Paenibacillus amylolyticus]|uniref:hypothetical protein n=1 Tax=Paenibacillus amylolyticus TaxID=1451 RepID=UPI00096D3C46|nr:hypothetical protein [Paenibacillus amylolyticus]OMF47718.1 hypothetical protein BK136_02165 [Paenibacillus amylolyticus]
MKLHKDGTVEGTPQEIAEYNQLTGVSVIENGRCDYIKQLQELNKQAVAATSKQQRDDIITEADKVRALIQQQKDYQNNRSSEDDPKVSYAHALQKASFMSGMKVAPNAWGETVTVHERDEEEPDMSGYTRMQLVNELNRRTGVEKHGMGKEVEFSLIAGTNRVDSKGEATVLIIHE